MHTTGTPVPTAPTPRPVGRRGAAAQETVTPELPAPRRLTGSGQRARSLGRRLTGLLAAFAAAVAVGVGGAAPASAMTIQNGDQSYVYLGWYWDSYWTGSYWHYEPVLMYSPPAGAGRWYCWMSATTIDGCWWEQHPWRQY